MTIAHIVDLKNSYRKEYFAYLHTFQIAIERSILHINMLIHIYFQFLSLKVPGRSLIPTVCVINVNKRQREITHCS